MVTFLLWLPFGKTGRKMVLVAASLFFYVSWDIRFLGILAFVWAVIFYIPRRISSTERFAAARWKTLGVALLLTVLFLFKYFDFFLGSLLSLLSIDPASGHAVSLKLIVPLGLSFYTFVSISYILDVHSRKVEASKSLLDNALFVSFFPLILAGPIEKGSHWMPQVREFQPFKLENVRDAFERMLLGYLLKVAVADPLVPLCDDVFNRCGSAGSGELAAAGVGYSLLILADFAGYSLIARGTAKLFGYDIVRNFEQPYFSRSFSEFWRRWHISLSTWIWSYVFHPLMNRILRFLQPLGFRTTHTEVSASYAVSVLLTMLLCGLWHGAGFTFVVWGGLHGVFLVIERLLVYGRKPISTRKRIRGFKGMLQAGVSWVVVFSLVTLAWIVFRSPDISSAMTYLTRMLTAGGWTMPVKLLTRVVLAAGILLVIEGISYRKGSEWLFRHRGRSISGLFVLAFSVIIMLGGFGGAAPFIYLQF